MPCKIMILIQEFPLISKICKVASVLHVTKFRLDRGSSPLKIIHSDGKSYIQTKPELRWYFFIFLVALILIQYLQKEVISSMESVQFWLSISCHFCCTCQIFIMEAKSGEIKLYVNSLYKFHYTHQAFMAKRPPVLQARVGILLAKCLTISILILPVFFVYGLHWVKPCKVSLVGYWVLRECQATDGRATNLPGWSLNCVKLAVFFLNHWMWVFGLHGSTFGVTVISTLAIVCLRDFIER